MDYFDQVILKEENNLIQTDNIKQAFFNLLRTEHIFSMDRMIQITNQTEDAIVNELKSVLILNPATNQYEFIDDYLLKDQYESLLEAKARVKEGAQVYWQNVDLLTSLLRKNAWVTYNQALYFLTGQTKNIRKVTRKKKLLQDILLKVKMQEASDPDSIRHFIGQLNNTSLIQGFIEVNHKQYEDDMIHMMINPHTIEIIPNKQELYDVFMESVERISQYLPDQNIYITASTVHKRKLSRLTNLDNVTWVYEKDLLNIVEDSDNIILVFDYGTLKKPGKCYEIKNQAILFSNVLALNTSNALHSILNFTIGDFLSSIQVKSAKDLDDYLLQYGDQEIRIVGKHCIYDHSTGNIKVNFENNHNDVNHYDRQYHSLDYGLDHNHYGKKQRKKHLERLLLTGFTNNYIHRNSKLEEAANIISMRYYEDPSLYQIILYDGDKKDELPLISSRIMVDPNDLEIVGNGRFKKHIVIGNTNDFDFNKLPSNIIVYQLDVPDHLETLITRNINPQVENIIYYLSDSHDNEKLQTIGSEALLAYKITNNPFYLQFIGYQLGNELEKSLLEICYDFSHLFKEDVYEKCT